MADGEARLADRGVEIAWLACAIGNERAARFGTCPVSAMARSTVSRSFGSTLRTLFTTRDTVARETPATRATSSRVGGCVVTCLL